MTLSTQVYAAFTYPLAQLGQVLWEVVPSFLLALVLLVVGYAAAYVVGEAVTYLLKLIRFEKWLLDHTGANAYVGGLRLGHLLGTLTKWYLWMLFWPSAAGLVHSFTALSNFILTLSVWVPRLITGVLVALVGFVIAEYVAARIVETKAKLAHVLSGVFQAGIIIFTLFAVLRVLDLDLTLAGTTFLILVACLGLAVALAVGIGFGIALQDEAKQLVKKLRKQWK